jgi:2-(3-amino-3-carboxypropyl)histidine synthase
MEVVFVKAVYNKCFSISETLVKKLPGKVGLVSTIQFLDSLARIKEELEKQGKEVFIGGQILGCRQDNALKVQDKVQAFLYIGSGKFHVLGLAMKFVKEIPIFMFNPATQESSEFDWQEARKLKQKQKAQKTKFLISDRIGILVSIKPGQMKLNRALELKNELEKQGKKAYLFLIDNLDSSQFENFSKIGWVNTACPGIFYDTSVYNL